MYQRALCLASFDPGAAVTTVSNVAKRSMAECRYHHIISSCTSLQRITSCVMIIIIIARAHAHVTTDIVTSTTTRHGRVSVSAI